MLREYIHVHSLAINALPYITLVWRERYPLIAIIVILADEGYSRTEDFVF